MRCILVSGCRRVRQACNISLGIILTVADYLALHAYACMVWMQLPASAARWRHALAHFEERVHLLVATHLVSQDRVCAHRVVITRLVDV